MRCTIPSAAICWRWALARLSTLAPGHRRVGLSATVKDPAPLQRFLVPQPLNGEALSALVIAAGRRQAADRDQHLGFLCPLGRASGAPRHAGCDGGDPRRQNRAGLRQHPQPGRTHLPGIVGASTTPTCPSPCITAAWRRNSAARWKRPWRKGALRAVVCTSTLDLGIDWGAVDKVICIGAPKGAARLVQRIGRANHRLDEPSAALLVPANRFEVLECNAARDAVLAGELDGERLKAGGLDVLAQHVLGTACAAPFDADALFAEVRSAVALRPSHARGFRRGGGFRRHRRLCAAQPMTAMRGCARPPDGKFRLAHPRLAQEYRLNAGVIVEDPMVEMRLQSRGKPGRRRRPQAGRAGGIFHRAAVAGRHLRLRRPGAALRRPARRRGAYVTKHQRSGSGNPQLQWRQVSAFHLPGPAGARDGQRARTLAQAARAGAGMAEDPGMAQRDPQARPVAGRDLSPRQPALSGLLSLRRPAGAPDAGHAADAAAGTAAPASPGLCRQ